MNASSDSRGGLHFQNLLAGHHRHLAVRSSPTAHEGLNSGECVCVCLYARATCRANVFLSVSRQAVLVMLCQERISSYGCQEHSLEKADDDE